MTPWSATMSPTPLLTCVLATWLFATVGAITVSIERADVKADVKLKPDPQPPTQSSMIANGWRPLMATSSYEQTIGTNVSPSSHLEKNVQVHPVLSKLQEHMAASEKLKPLRKGKPPVHEYSPPSILGSFTVFGHAATKARDEAPPKAHKHAASESREYTFLVPPPKDAYRFEMNQHRKPIVRDSGNYPRQPQYAAPAQSMRQQAADPMRAANYFIKGYASTTNPSTDPANHPSNRPYVPPFAMPQALQALPRQPAKPFESFKVVMSNAKPFLQPPGIDVAGNFGKQKINGDGAYDRYQQAQSHSAQVLNSASSGNFYSQVNHPGHFKNPSYERDPAFLVHESHEIGYVTPSGVFNGYNFHPSLPYDTLLPPAVYASSTPPSTTVVTRNPVNGYGHTDQVEHDFKRTDQRTRNKHERNQGRTETPNVLRTTSTYYVSEHQDLTSPTWSSAPKSKYTSDINEVLPRENPPAKFSQEVVSQNQITQLPKVPYRATQPNVFESVEIYQQTSVPEYETPESISLKHFNEQQFLLQQQLLQRDRERLAEQERQQKLEIEQRRQEELKKQQQQQEQLNQLEQEDKQEDQDVSRVTAGAVGNQSQVGKVSSETPYTIQLNGAANFEPHVTTDVNFLVSEPGIYNVQQLRIQPQAPQFPENQVNQNYQYEQNFPNEYQEEQQVDYRDPQSETRPYRPQKPSRDPHRRKKPTTVAYEVSPTEPPSQPESSLTFHEEVPIQTTVAPETQTAPVVTTSPSRSPSRTRRPGVPGRRRKPSTTTQEPITHVDEDFLKYVRDDEVQNQYDPSRRRRIKPSQASLYNEDADRRGSSRKRPSHRNRVNHEDARFDARVVTENAHASLRVTDYYGQTTESPGYNENGQLATSEPGASYETNREAGESRATNQPIGNQYYDYSSQQSDAHREDDGTVPGQVEYLTEAVNRGRVEDYNVDTRPQNVVTRIPLEELYVKTDGNYYDRATTMASTTTTAAMTTTTTPEPATQTTQVVSSTLRSHKMRPLRYGNATRPRFSIKDYKSRLDYKSKLSQDSSTTDVSAPAVPTEAPVESRRSPHTKQRTPSAKVQQQAQQPPTDTVRETTGRYKYVSRVNYRTTSTTPATLAREYERSSEEKEGATTEKSNKFVPKRRPISGNVYRSRIASTTSSPTRSQVNGQEAARQSSTRPENVYSSSIRRRPIAKARPHKEQRYEPSTEMTAEETSFYASVTTTSSSSTGRLVGNEIVSEKGQAATLDSHPVKLGVQESKNQGHQAETGGDDSAPRGDALNLTEATTTADRAPISNDVPQQNGAVRPEADGKTAEPPEATTRFDVPPDEEELFAKASQSVADLTSSASALYDKPGMFKAVSPESRMVSSHLKVATDEPTLPIEAFFQELSKKN